MELFISGVKFVKNINGGIIVKVATEDIGHEGKEFMTKNNVNLFTDNDNKFIVLGV